MPLWRAISLTFPLQRLARPVKYSRSKVEMATRFDSLNAVPRSARAGSTAASSRASMSTSSIAPGSSASVAATLATFTSSRTLPGQSCEAMRCSIHASTVETCWGLPTRRHTSSTSRPRSLSRSRSAGSSTRTWAMRKKRSLRKRPAFISAPRSRRVAASTRTSMGSNALPPTRFTCFSLSARRSFGCSSMGSSPSSSRKSVPPSASASAPLRRSVAPVNAPFSWPKRMLSASVGGMLPQSTTTKGPALRSLAWWIALATSSLPVPVSPTMRTLSGVPDTFSRTPKTRRIFGELPTSGPNRSEKPTSTRRLASGCTTTLERPTVSSAVVAIVASRTRTGPTNVPFVLPRSLTRMPSLTARSSQWNALTSGSARTMFAPASRPTTSASTSIGNCLPSGAVAVPPETNQCITRVRVSVIGSMHAGGVRAGRWRLHEDVERLEHRELLARDADPPVAEEEVVFLELRACLGDEENRIGVARVPELHERALGPLAALKRDGPPQHVKTLGRQLHQAVGPRQAAKRQAGAVEMPPVVHVVLGGDDDRQARVGVVVEVHEHASGNVSFVLG